MGEPYIIELIKQQYIMDMISYETLNEKLKVAYEEIYSKDSEQYKNLLKYMKED